MSACARMCVCVSARPIIVRPRSVWFIMLEEGRFTNPGLPSPSLFTTQKSARDEEKSIVRNLIVKPWYCQGIFWISPVKSCPNLREF